MDSYNITNTANRLSNQPAQIDTNGIMSKGEYFRKNPGARERYKKFLRNINNASKSNKSTDFDLNEAYPRRVDQLNLEHGQKIESIQEYFKKIINEAQAIIDADLALQSGSQTEERKSNGDEYRSPYTGSSSERAGTTKFQNLQQIRSQSADSSQIGM